MIDIEYHFSSSKHAILVLTLRTMQILRKSKKQYQVAATTISMFLQKVWTKLVEVFFLFAQKNSESKLNEKYPNINALKKKLK